MYFVNIYYISTYQNAVCRYTAKTVKVCQTGIQTKMSYESDEFLICESLVKILYITILIVNRAIVTISIYTI